MNVPIVERLEPSHRRSHSKLARTHQSESKNSPRIRAYRTSPSRPPHFRLTAKINEGALGEMVGVKEKPVSSSQHLGLQTAAHPTAGHMLLRRPGTSGVTSLDGSTRRPSRLGILLLASGVDRAALYVVQTRARRRRMFGGIQAQQRQRRGVREAHVATKTHDHGQQGHRHYGAPRGVP